MKRMYKDWLTNKWKSHLCSFNTTAVTFSTWCTAALRMKRNIKINDPSLGRQNSLKEHMCVWLNKKIMNVGSTAKNENCVSQLDGITDICWRSLDFTHQMCKTSIFSLFSCMLVSCQMAHRYPNWHCKSQQWAARWAGWSIYQMSIYKSKIVIVLI